MTTGKICLLLNLASQNVQTLEHLRKILVILGLFALSACAQTPVTVVERVNVPTFLPVPSTLVAPVKADLYPGITYGEAVGSLYSGLQSCNADKAAIGSLKPPRL